MTCFVRFNFVMNDSGLVKKTHKNVSAATSAKIQISRRCLIRPRGYKTFFVLNSTIVGIFIFISRENFMLSNV